MTDPIKSPTPLSEALDPRCICRLQFGYDSQCPIHYPRHESSPSRVSPSATAEMSPNFLTADEALVCWRALDRVPELDAVEYHPAFLSAHAKVSRWAGDVGTFKCPRCGKDSPHTHEGAPVGQPDGQGLSNENLPESGATRSRQSDASSRSPSSPVPSSDDVIYILHELRGTFAEIEKGETVNTSRSTDDEDTTAHRFFGSYVPRKMTITDAKQLAHHAVLKIDRWLKEHPDV